MVETTYNLNTSVSIALLSDLHGHNPQPVLQALSSHMKHHPLDMIMVVGDFIYGSWPVDDKSPLETQEHVLPFLSGCAEIVPTFVSLGNHEHMLDEEDLTLIRRTGATLLDNSFSTVDIHTADGKEVRVAIAGLTSAYVTDYRRAVEALRSSVSDFPRYPKKESIRGLDGLKTASERIPDTHFLSQFAATPADYRILLCHHPEYINLIPESIDLVLSGHAHGGQWRYYSLIHREWRGVFAPGQGWWPRFTHGIYYDRLVISAGLSNTARIPRINNPVEIVYIT